MGDRLKGFRTVVTGGSGGIGLGIAKAFAAEGADVWLVGRDAGRLDAARDLLGGTGVEVRTTAADLCEADSVARVAADVLDAWPRVDTLVNNAGVARFTPFERVPAEEIRLQVQLNLLAPYLLTQALLPGLSGPRASVVNISSTSAHRLIPGRPASVYAMTKGGINSLAKALALELGPRGVRVNAVAPGTIDTPLTRNTIESFTPERRAEYDKFVQQSFALGRLGGTEDVAAAAVYFASLEAKWVTGSVLVVDGGLSTN